MLRGKVVMITGASRGLGKALALAFAEGGANLVINSRNADSLDPVAEEARVVDEHLYTTEPLDRRIYEPLDVRAPGYVRWEREDLNPPTFGFLGDGLERFSAAGGYDEVRAFFRAGEREGPAKPPAGPGNHDDLPS